MVFTINYKSEKEIEREFPYSHFIQFFMPVLFLIIWILDSFFLKISTSLSDSVPLIIRLMLFLMVLATAFILIQLSHKALFGESHSHPDRVIEFGIMARVRHPMYLGVMLIYLAFLLTTFSLICLLLLIGVFIVYNKMASFEEKQLEMLFGEDYLKYKARVRKWIPG